MTATPGFSPPPASAESDTAPPRIETRNVSFLAGAAKLVDAVTLQAFAGEVLALVGPNGAGKSTLLRLLAHELEASSGEVLVGGRPIGDYAARELAKRRAVLPQQTVMQFAFTAFDVVMMGSNPHIENGWPGAEDRAVAERSMQQTEALEFRARIYAGLSGGEQSRVTFARVLAQQTPVLLLDEPTASLDVKHQERAMQVARNLAAEGICVVVIVHDLNLAAAYADRIALLHRGRLIECAPPSQLLRAGLLSEVFECRLKVIEDDGRLIVIPERGPRRGGSV
jgi:iron complex transport system ATP-binding protein